MRILYYIGQMLQVVKYWDKVRFKRLRVTLGSGVSINVHKHGLIKFEGISTIQSQFKVEVLPHANVVFGDKLFINRGTTIVARYSVTFGRNCMIGEYVQIYDHNHVFNRRDKPFNEQGYKGAAIVIGNNVWIGSHVFIGQGVRIGDNVVIGAGCVVMDDIPSNSLVRHNHNLTICPIRYADHLNR